MKLLIDDDLKLNSHYCHMGIIDMLLSCFCLNNQILYKADVNAECHLAVNQMAFSSVNKSISVWGLLNPCDPDV